MEGLEYDTYDPILYMRTLGLLEPDISIQKYDGFIEKMKKKLTTCMFPLKYPPSFYDILTFKYSQHKYR